MHNKDKRAALRSENNGCCNCICDYHFIPKYAYLYIKSMSFQYRVLLRIIGANVERFTCTAVGRARMGIHIPHIQPPNKAALAMPIQCWRSNQLCLPLLRPLVTNPDPTSASLLQRNRGGQDSLAPAYSLQIWSTCLSSTDYTRLRRRAESILQL